MKALAVLAALLLTGSVLWLAGEQHRENCIRQNRYECTVLPWDNGRPHTPPRHTSPGFFDESTGDSFFGDP